jgi:DNA-binding response OmpR family regulator
VETSETRGVPAEAKAGRAKLAALVLDSDTEFVAALQNRTTKLGCRMERLEDGSHLDEELARTNPACLVLSRDEPEIHALDVIGSLRDSAAWASLPIFVVGRRLGTDAALEALGAGADAALSKTRSEGMAELAARILGASHRRDEVVVPPAEASPAGTETDVPDVLVVEDDPALIEMLNYSLSNQGYRLEFHANGRQALEALLDMRVGSRRPVVLLDVDLPGMDGFRILQELTAARPGDFQVIMATMHRSEAAQVLAIESGALDYIVKPISLPITLAKVERLVRAGGGP